MARPNRWQELIFPLGIISSVLVIMVPLPPMLMDFMLAANITMAVIVLLTTIYVQTPLEFNIFPSLLLATTFLAGLANADEQSSVESRTRILSWNISDDAFASHAKEVQALLFRWSPDLLLLDEVSPSVTVDQLRRPLEGISLDVESEWHVDIGKSGGRQRGVILSR